LLTYRVEFLSTCVDLVVVVDDFECNALRGDHQADQAEEHEEGETFLLDQGLGISTESIYRFDDPLLVHDISVIAYDPYTLAHIPKFGPPRMETSSGQVQTTHGDDESELNKSASRRAIFPGVIGSLSITSEESGRSLIQRTRSTIRSSRWSPSSN
jgi:hypothetical protein